MYSKAFTSDAEASAFERSYLDWPLPASPKPGPAQAPAQLDAALLSFDERDRVYRHGEPVGDTYEIVEGAVMLWLARPDGRRKIIQILRPGQSFGQSAGPQRGETAEVIKATRLRVLPAVPSAANACATSALLRQALERIDWLQRHSMVLGRMTALERVACFLLEQPTLSDRPLPETGAATIRLDLTREDMADHLGLTVETISRCLGRLKRAGLIAIKHLDSVTIRDLAGLGAVAEGEMLEAS